MSSIWRFCFGSEHWIVNGSGEPFVQPLLYGTRICFPLFCQSRLHHGTLLIGHWRQSAASIGHYRRPFKGSGLCFQMKYRDRRGRIIRGFARHRRAFLSASRADAHRFHQPLIFHRPNPTTTLRSSGKNAEINAKIDDYIKANPKRWE
jgi:hypothetical protein